MSEDADSPTSQTDSAKKPVQRLGFLAGQFAVPDDFNQMAGEQICLLLTGQDVHMSTDLENSYQSS